MYKLLKKSEKWKSDKTFMIYKYQNKAK